MIRQQLHLTQEELAHALGVTVSTVNRWENGHTHPSRLARNALEALIKTGGSSADAAASETATR
jgi:putative transcriptional regulator